MRDAGSRALVTINAQGSTRTLFQSTSFGQPVIAVPSQCDRAGLQGLVLGLDTIHWISSGLASFARGTNDAPKIVAMLLLGSASATWPNPLWQLVAFGGVALAMGSWAVTLEAARDGSTREKVTRMDHAEGCLPT